MSDLSSLTTISADSVENEHVVSTGHANASTVVPPFRIIRYESVLACGKAIHDNIITYTNSEDTAHVVQFEGVFITRFAIYNRNTHIRTYFVPGKPNQDETDNLLRAFVHHCPMHFTRVNVWRKNVLQVYPANVVFGNSFFKKRTGITRQSGEEPLLPSPNFLTRYVRRAGADFGDGLTTIIPQAVESLEHSLVNAVNHTISSTFSAGDTFDATDLVVQFGELATAAYLSNQNHVRITLVVHFVHRLLSHFKLTKYLVRVGVYLFHLFVKHCREVLGGISEDVVHILKDALRPWGVSLPDMGVIRQGLGQSLTVGVLMQIFRELLTYIKRVTNHWWSTNSWTLMRANLKEQHRNLYMMLEGNRLIRNSGDHEWLHRNANNALFAARVVHYANLCAAQYETCPLPIDKTMFLDAVKTARGNALVASGLFLGHRAGSVVVYICGPTRQGKTIASQKIAGELNHRLGVPRNTTFAFPISSQFRDGYCGQPVVLLSDTFRLCDHSQRVPEADFIMRAHDTDPFPLDMSRAEEKGSVFFNSPYVICTSNINLMAENFSATSVGLTDMDALRARLDIYVSAKCVDETIMRTVTISGMESRIIDDALIASKYPNGAPNSIYQFTLIDGFSRRPIQTLTFDELVDRIDALRVARWMRFIGGFNEPPWGEIDEMIVLSGDAHSLPPQIKYCTPDVRIHGPQEVTSQSSVCSAQSDDEAFATTRCSLVCGNEQDERAAGFDRVFTPDGEPQADFSGWDGIPGYYEKLFEKYVQALQSNSNPTEESRQWTQNRLVLTTLGMVIGCSIGIIGTLLLVRPPKQPKYRREAYDSSKVGRTRVIKLRPRGPPPAQTYEVTAQQRMEQLEDFLLTRFPMDAKVHEKSDMVVETAQPTECLASANPNPYVRQGCEDPNALQMVGSALINHIYWGECVQLEGASPIAQFFNIVGTYFTVPLHVAARLKSAVEVRLYGSASYVFDADLFSIVAELPESEIAIVQVHRSSGFPEGKDLVKKFLSERELFESGNKVMCAVRLFDNNHSAAFFGSCNASFLKSLDIKRLNESCDYEVAVAIQYPLMQTFVGMCGAPVISMSGAVTGRIVGIHCAGDSRTSGGMGGIVTREQLYKHVAIVDPARAIADLQELTLEDTANVASVPVWAPINKSMIQMQADRTNLRPSKVYGLFCESDSNPAMLRPVNGVDPLVQGQLKWCGRSIGVKHEIIDRVGRAIRAHLLVKCAEHNIGPPRVMTLMESLNGIEGEVERINLDSSPGFPFNCLLQGSKRRWVWTDCDGHVEAIHPFLLECVDMIEKEISEDRTPCVIFKDSLKDEKRSIEKCDAGNTRVFAAAPFHYTIVFRRYVSYYIWQLSRIAAHTPLSPGLDVHGKDWQIFYTRFSRIPGDNWINGDCKNFDGTVPSMVMLRLATTVVVPTLPMFRNQIMSLMRCTAYAKHVSGNKIYQFTHGMPSGTVITAFMNCLVLLCMLMLAWQEAGYQLSEFFEKVEVACYGDDSIGKVHPDYDKFDMIQIAKTMSRFDMIYTSADKTKELQPYARESEVTYLKRSFRHEDGTVFAPLPLDHVYDIPNWVRGLAKDEDANLKSMFDSFCVEMSHHPKYLYDVRTQELCTALNNRGIFVLPPHYDTLMKRYN